MTLEKWIGAAFIVGAWVVTTGVYIAWRVDVACLDRARARIRELEAEIAQAGPNTFFPTPSPTAQAWGVKGVRERSD